MRYALDDFVAGHAGHKRGEYVARRPNPMLFIATDARGTALPLTDQKTLVDAKTRRLTRDMVRTPIETQAFVLADRSPIHGHLIEIVNKAGHETRGFVGLGRSEEADLNFDDPTICERHALFRRAETGEVTIIDANSQFGSFRRGLRLPPRHEQALMNHDDLRFGESTEAVYFTAHGLYEFLQACRLSQPQ